ncbi:cofilin-2-like isoform X1 [Oncorhynchus nerka]|uniref:cofilin-2-like isoform X1 n=1 Tax=Oncorhynchus nerka TaxID=8023 RepID=UPI0031B80D59
MASGIAVHDDVVLTFDKIRVRLQGADKQEQLKLVLFKISDDGKCIVVDEDKCLKVKDLNGEEDVFRKIVNMMPTEDCRYALYDCSWESKDSPKEDLVFIMWAPEHSTIKKKMKYASSKQYIKAKFQDRHPNRPASQQTGIPTDRHPNRPASQQTGIPTDRHPNRPASQQTTGVANQVSGGPHPGPTPGDATGLKFEWQVNDMSDAKDSSVFIDKLGGRGVVKRLEGKEV